MKQSNPASFFLLLILAVSVFSQSYTWKNVNLQGMGFVTGIYAHPLDSQLIYAKTDVGGVYRLNPSTLAWIPLIDGKGISYGIESFCIDPRNKQVVYMATDSTVYRSADQGASWTKQTIRVFENGNGDWRQAGERLAVDPNNSATIYFGTRTNGLWKSDNSGTIWTQVSTGSVPAGSDAGISFVVFDPASGTTTTPSQKIYAGVMGTGVYRSSNGGTSWSLISGGPAVTLRPIGAAVSSDGTVYFAYAGSPYGGLGAIYKFNGTTMSAITPTNTAGSGFCGISVDPKNPLHLLTYEFNAGPTQAIHRSTNGGTTWSQLRFDNGTQGGTKTVTEPSYYPAYSSWTYAGEPLIDYAGNGWLTTGFGVYRCTNLGATTPQWTAVMNNLEELCVNLVKTPPIPGGAELFSGVADMLGFRHLSTDSIPTAKIMPGQFGYMSGLAYCATNPSVIAFVGSDQNNGVCKAQYSTNGGETWSNFATTPSGAFNGNIAISATNPLRMVWAPLAQNWTTPANVATHYTINGGATWQVSSGLPGSNDASVQWSSSQFLVADKVNDNIFYCYDPGYWPAPTGVLYRSTDGGVSFSVVKAGLPQAWQMKIESVPGKEGHLWFTTRGSSALMRSIDSGKSWISLSGVLTRAVGFGKPVSPSTEPTVYIYGTVNNSKGVFRSVDYGTSWNQISTGNIPDAVMDIEGDLRYAGRVYVATSGRGILRGDQVVQTASGAGARLVTRQQVPAKWTLRISSARGGFPDSKGALFDLMGRTVPSSSTQKAMDRQLYTTPWLQCP